MPQDPNAQFDSTVLEKIELSPTGAIPHTPAYQDALKRLMASHQVYADADHKDGYVTARSLTNRPFFHAENLEAVAAGKIADTELESNAAVFERYVQSLNPSQRAKAEAYRVSVPGKPIHHRKHAGSDRVIHDPVHTLFLVPGSGPHPGLPGNYLFGFIAEVPAKAGSGGWELQLHDNQDGVEICAVNTFEEAFAKLQDVLASSPFHLVELAEMGFHAG